MIQYVTFIPTPTRVKVFIMRKYHGSIEGSKLISVLSNEELAVYSSGQYKMLMNFDKLKPYLTK
jgi:hypothetical protein